MKKVLRLNKRLKSSFIRVGSRQSALAIAQVNEVEALFKSINKEFSFKRTTFKTAGDQDKTTPLTNNVADDFFTNTIDEALLNHTIDIAIHSAKDLPKYLNPQLTIAALTECLDESDAFVGLCSFDQLPLNARIGTSSLLRQESIKSLRADIKLVNVRGTIEERIRLINQGKVDGIIVATCALKRLKLDHLIKTIMPWEGTPLQGQLAIVCRYDDQRLINLFRNLDIRPKYGQVLLVGAGPGDPTLITLKGIEALKKADCIFYDYLVDHSLMQYAPKAEHIYVGKRKGIHSISQTELCRQIRLKAMSGQCVVRLKGGDPLVFGRGAEELQYLQSYCIQTKVIAGVSSATGLTSMLGVPLTARRISSSVSFISAHEENEHSETSSLIKIPNTDTVVIFMGLTKISQIVKSFKEHNWDQKTPVLIISQGSRHKEMVVTGTLSTIEKNISTQNVHAPALIVVGQTVNFYKPAENQKKILFLGTHPQEYLALGQIIHWPMIHIIPRQISSKESQDILKQFHNAQLVVLTSEYAVKYFEEFLTHNGQKFSSKQDVEYAVIGSYTAQALINRGVYPKYVSPVETAEGMFKGLKKRYSLRNMEIFFPRSTLPNPLLKNSLLKAGAKVFEFPIYKNVKPQRRPLPKEEIHAVFFTSPSTVENFLKDYQSIPSNWEILCKGPVSKAALTKQGYNAQII